MKSTIAELTYGNLRDLLDTLATEPLEAAGLQAVLYNLCHHVMHAEQRLAGLEKCLDE